MMPLICCKKLVLIFAMYVCVSTRSLTFSPKDEMQIKENHLNPTTSLTFTSSEKLAYSNTGQMEKLNRKKKAFSIITRYYPLITKNYPNIFYKKIVSENVIGEPQRLRAPKYFYGDEHIHEEPKIASNLTIYRRPMRLRWGK